MGPLFFRAENRTKAPGSRSNCPRFNGAALFQSGEHATPYKRLLRATCFNGAALFQSGEPPPRHQPHHHPAMLQWGRSFSERRTICRSTAPEVGESASMGPLFFRAENFRAMTTPFIRPIRLQWGRSFSERRTMYARHRANLMVLASMGPLFFRAENTCCGIWCGN